VISSEVLRVSGNQEGPQNVEFSLLFYRAADNGPNQFAELQRTKAEVQLESTVRLFDHRNII
jgi:hypothetical protein